MYALQSTSRIKCANRRVDKCKTHTIVARSKIADYKHHISAVSTVLRFTNIFVFDFEGSINKVCAYIYRNVYH